MAWRRKNYDELTDILMRDGVKLDEFDYCWAHDKRCRRLPRRGSSDEISILCAGSPCPDWSSYGDRGRGDAGPRAHLFIILTLVFNDFG